jgi:hypothetical protein
MDIYSFTSVLCPCTFVLNTYAIKKIDTYSIVLCFFYVFTDSFFILSSKIKNRKAHSQVKEIIWNVFKYFQNKNEYIAKCRLYTMTAEATGYSTMSVKCILYMKIYRVVTR